jgi:hypothetical protein
MRRDSFRAQATVVLLRGAGVTIDGREWTGRNLEHYSSTGLVPPGDANEEQVIKFFRELDLLGYKSGASPDRAALTLLPRGCPCERVREAIIRGLGGDGLAAAAQPPTMLAALKHARSNMEKAGQVVGEAFEALPADHILSTILKKSAAMTQRGGRIDYAGALIGPLEETPEQRGRVIADTFVEVMVGEEAHDPSAIDDMANLLTGTAPSDLSRGEDSAVRALLGTVTPGILQWFDIVRRASLWTLSDAAQRCRPMVTLMAAMLKQRWPDAQIDEHAALIAPALLIYEQGR